MTQLSRLFEPGKIGGLEVRNRIVMAPLGTYSADKDGCVNQRTIDYYVERAKGGVGLIITQGTAFVPEAHPPHVIGIYDDRFMPGLKALARAVQSFGAKIVCQPNHLGVMLPAGYVGYERPPEAEPVGPSAKPSFTHKVTPRELSRGEIHRLVEAWAEAGRRAQAAGFDAVEIHGAHGYLLGSFLSPLTNRRTDEYGGAVENRARFACEIIRRTREKVGPDFPVLIRMNGSDFLRGGLTIEEARRQAIMFVEAGVDALDISAAIQESREWRDLTYLFPDGAIVHLAEAIKKFVSVPVITVGKIGDPLLAERVLEEGKADFIAMGRALFADPDLANKARAGQMEDIRRCLYCNNCRLGFLAKERIMKRGTTLGCTVNPALLRETEFRLKPAAVPKKVMVIGGGLAGIEAARVLAERGHRVTLYEKDGRLGGQWRIASSIPSKEGFGGFLEYQLRGLEKAGVRLNLNAEVTREMVRELAPDAVVVATGAVSQAINVPGADGPNVVQAVDVFAGKAVTGDRVVVIGGRLRGMEVAHLLAGLGKYVSLVTRNRLGEDGEPLERNLFVTLRNMLAERRVMIFALSPVVDIRKDGVHIINNGELMFLTADTVVMAVGARPENGLAAELQGLVPELYAIGDCVKARDAREAVNEGAEVGRRI
ncbi:MAG: FAD-dependent oxidoreductase [Chloroflexi bacterium]|nr:FAD-dependent oxidoreductase [Chloroflexota bacterium]